MQTLQDMLTVEDFDVSDAFQHSRSTESIKSVACESYMSKLNVAKRRANQQETEMFYFSVSSCQFFDCSIGQRFRRGRIQAFHNSNQIMNMRCIWIISMYLVLYTEIFLLQPFWKL